VTGAGLLAIRERLAASRLARAGGGAIVRLLAPDTLGALQAEALAAHPDAVETLVEQGDGEENRGGSPERGLDSSVGGPVLHGLYHAPEVLDALGALTDVEWTPSGGEGSYSYYCRPGHHLGLHRDVDECDLALIVCILDDRPEQAGDAGSLCLYPGRSHEPLSAIRATPERGEVRVRATPGEAVVLLGGVVPHRVLPVGERHVRIVAPLCYRAAG
jgi:hypothetical protein